MQEFSASSIAPRRYCVVEGLKTQFELDSVEQALIMLTRVVATEHGDGGRVLNMQVYGKFFRVLRPGKRRLPVVDLSRAASHAQMFAKLSGALHHIRVVRGRLCSNSAAALAA